MVNLKTTPRVLVREDAKHPGLFLALDPESGEPLTRIPSLTSKTIWAINERGSTVSAEHEHAVISWPSLKDARAQLTQGGYEFITD
jgi:hypothetical protein